MTNLPEPPRPGLTSLVADKTVPEAFYRVAGFHVCGPRAVRIDMLERLADLIRPLVAWRADPANPAPPPKGATGDGGFKAIPEMMSILGCSGGELGNVLQALGFRLDRRRVTSPAPVPEQATTASPAPSDPQGDAAVVQGEAPVVAVADQAAPSQPEAAETVAEAQREPTVAIEAPDTQAVAATSASETSVSVETKPDEQWEEVWRPRRHHHGQRPRRPGRERFRGKGKPPASEAAQQEQQQHKQPPKFKKPGGRPDHRERRRGGRDSRRDERPRPLVQSSSPPAKAGFDPDSPFAALHSLKLALEKPRPE